MKNMACCYTLQAFGAPKRQLKGHNAACEIRLMHTSRKSSTRHVQCKALHVLGLFNTTSQPATAMSPIQSSSVRTTNLAVHLNTSVALE
jgi:hypothetical protein